MATDKIKTAVPNSVQPARPRWRAIALLALVVLLAGYAWYRTALREDALAAASYGARIGCSCRFVAGRDLSSCKADFEPGMGLVRLSEDAEAGSVTASVPLLSSQTATYREGEGCRLEPWDG
ncbi:MAG: hypothetical protein KDE55_16625 [Novosphingobium sp.]|nr:hypothetical protein [Novosphingobium sp.]